RSAPMFLPFPDSFPPGAYHAAELPYLFDDPKAQLNEAQLRLSQKMVAAWTRFARTGSPGWEPYGHVERLAPGGGNVDYAREHRLGFWRGLG
ncbi:MAG: carboxylesterase family protein, partial [Nonomuraea sp.]|nr:carboxylesterase family protein [Nonomuraea sp.]